MKKTYIIFEKANRAIWCAAETEEIAKEIIRKDVESGEAEEGELTYIYTQFFGKNDKL